MKYKIVAHLIKGISSLLLFTCRIKVVGMENFTKTISNSSVILTFWHDQMALFAKTFYPYRNLCTFVAVISKSRDGNWLDAIVKSYPNGDTLRVAHDKRPSALKAIITTLQQKRSTIMITPDGPRGPRHVLKPGPILAAKESGAPLILFSYKASSFFTLSSWDKFTIPKPFSKITINISPPIFLSKDDDTEEERLKVESLLNID